MGNNPSSQQTANSNQTNTNSRTNPTTSAPPTPTGNNHLTNLLHHHHHHHHHSPLNPHLSSTSSSTAATSSTSAAVAELAQSLPPPTTTFVDGGYLFPLSNIYPSSPQDWLHPIVQHLILSRRLAPFYRGLEDWEEDWDRQTIAHALQSITFSRINAIKQIQKIERQESIEQSNKHSSSSISKRFTKNLLPDHQSSPTSSSLFANPHNQSDNQSSHNNNVRHHIFEAVLNAQVRSNEIDQYLSQTVECPICFLYYPPNINLSRCCQQPICTECFTQIKRTDPTPQEIKSEPACCPYCVESNFGVTYEPPPPDKRTDWNPAAAVSSNTTTNTLAVPTAPVPTSCPAPVQSTVSSQSAPSPSPLMAANLSKDLAETGLTTDPASTKMKRRQTTSHMSKEVVTTDSIQPDWQAKLEAVKAAVQRRANRRIIFRQEGDRLIPVGITSSRDPNGSAFLAAFEHEHSGTSTVSRRGLSALIGSSSSGGGSSNSTSSGHNAPQGSGGSVRRHRNEASNYGMDLEELMVMEAMRLSLAEEEERKKKAAEEEEKFKKITQAITDACPGTDTPASNSSEEPSTSSTTTGRHQSTPAPSTSTSTPTPAGQLNAMLSSSKSATVSPLVHRPTTSQEGGSSTNPFSATDHPITDSPKLMPRDLDFGKTVESSSLVGNEIHHHSLPGLAHRIPSPSPSNPFLATQHHPPSSSPLPSNPFLSTQHRQPSSSPASSPSSNPFLPVQEPIRSSSPLQHQVPPRSPFQSHDRSPVPAVATPPDSLAIPHASSSSPLIATLSSSSLPGPQSS